MQAPPVLVRGPEAPSHPARRWSGYIIDAHEEAVGDQATNAHPAGDFNTATVRMVALMTAEYPQKTGRVDIPEQPGRSKPAYRKGHQRGGEQISCGTLFGFCVGKHIRNLVTPRGNLGADIEKLRHDCKDKMLTLEKRRSVSLLHCRLSRVIEAHMREGRARNQNAPEKDKRAENDVRHNNPERFQSAE